MAEEANRDFRAVQAEDSRQRQWWRCCHFPKHSLSFSASMSWKHPKTKQTAQETLISGLVGMMPGEQVKTRL